MTAGQLLTFTITASDPDGGTLTFTATGLPSGATLTPGANGIATFSWTPTAAQASANPYSVTVAVSDGALSDPETFTITVSTAAPVNLAPTVTNPGNKTVTAGSPLPFAITATDPNAGQTRTFSAGTTLPAGATLSASGAFAWTPTAAQVSCDALLGDGHRHRQRDPGAHERSGTFTITVQASTPTPVCTMTVSPTALAFGSVNVGSSKTMTTTIGNSGTANCTVSSRTVSGAGFALGSGAPSVPITIAPSANVSVPVNFTPTVAGAASGSLTIGSAVVSLSGTGVTVTPPTGGTGGAVDLNIVRFRATEEVELGEGKTVRFQLVVKNVSKVTGSAPATLVGIRNGVQVYRQALDVSAPAGKAATFTFPPYTPTAAGKIKWTVTIQDQGPARNTATATTEVEGEDREEREHSDRKRS